ncbi:DUF4870 domain-containing protein [Demequina sp. NBRC 110056]|uniref:DUF4870 domain-containing protein n=1 Tax=Demequina sp. NBRC 110056 TaxID=1570345 RepID=UPI0009FD1B1E|nr:DUF4870 domain-containing protein [Demequina sp. NBRC 110056]
MSENTSPQHEQHAPTAPVQPAPQQPYAPQPMLESEARMWSMLIHVVAAGAMVLSAGFLGFVVPLVLWLIYRERSALVDFHGKQNLNLQITVLVSGAAAFIVGLLLLGVGLFVTLPLWGLYALYALIISIVAGVKAHGGQYYKVPLIIPFVR